MPIEKIPDESGHTMRLIPFKGHHFGSPMFNEDALLNMDDFPLNEDDIILCSYPKSGCHWVWDIIHILVAGKIPSDDEIVEKEAFMMEWRPSIYYESLPSPRILNNHMNFDMQPRDFLAKKVKVVFIYRNFKDVAVSFYHHHTGMHEYEYNGDFGSHLKRWVAGLTDSGSPFVYTLGWEKGLADHPELPVFVSSYEDLKENNLAEVQRLSKFLGYNYPDDFLQKVCDITDFSAMKSRKGDKSFKNKHGEPVMYRKGQVGDWKNVFTVAQNEWFEEVIDKEMAGSKLRFKYTL